MESVHKLLGQLADRPVAEHSASRARMYRGADKSLAQPGRKKTISTEDFHIHISYL